MKKKVVDSQAIQFLDMAWRFTNSALPHAWLRLHQTMRHTLFSALEAGFKFDIDDFKKLGPRFNAGRWLGSNIEAFYSGAVKLGHNQAWNAYEAWTGRTPFIVDGKRVCAGTRLYWGDVLVDVTSFNDRDGSFTAVQHTGEYPRKILRRFTITHEKLKAAKKANAIKGSE